MFAVDLEKNINVYVNMLAQKNTLIRLSKARMDEGWLSTVETVPGFKFRVIRDWAQTERCALNPGFRSKHGARFCAGLRSFRIFKILLFYHVIILYSWKI